MKLRNRILWIASLTAAAQASALSLGGIQGQAILGSPLNISVQVIPDPGQTLDSSCIDASALFGDARASVTVSPQANQTVRIRSAQNLTEPLVSLKVQAGCSSKITRSYTLFAEPPVGAAAHQPINLAEFAPASPPAAAAPKPRAKPAPTPKPQAVKRVTAPAAPANPAPTEVAPTASSLPANTIALAPHPSAPTVSLQASTDLSSLEALRPVLRMDTLFFLPSSEQQERSTNTIETTINLPDGTDGQAAQAAATEHLLQLEKQLNTALAQQKNDKAKIQRLTSELESAQRTHEDQTQLQYILLGLLGLALAIIAALALRLRSAKKASEQHWLDTVHKADGQEASAPKDPQTQAKQPKESRLFKVRTRPAPDAVASAPALKPALDSASKLPREPALAPSNPNTPSAVSTPSAPSPSASSSFAAGAAVSTLTGVATIKGLDSNPEQEASQPGFSTQDILKTQEQADFFASIGEYDEATKLLQNQIKENPYASPLPYLSLLQIYYQLSRTAPFEETRQALESAFNIAAPQLSQYAQQGQDLEQAYPEILAHIVRQWPSDEVLDLIEGLLKYPAKVRVEAGRTVERFTPAAFNDLLMLYQVAESTPAAARGTLASRGILTAEDKMAATFAALMEASQEQTPESTNNAAAPIAPSMPQAAEPSPIDAAISFEDLQQPEPTAPGTPEAATPSTTPEAVKDSALSSFDLDFSNALSTDTAPEQAAPDLPSTPAAEEANGALLSDLSLDWDLPSAETTSSSEEISTPAQSNHSLLDSLDFDSLGLNLDTHPDDTPKPN